FSILEIKGWVDADQSTGRIIQVPNGLLFAKPLANYTEGFPYIWHEIPKSASPGRQCPRPGTKLSARRSRFAGPGGGGAGRRSAIRTAVALAFLRW
ncbi:MAG: hypothetical protein HKN80_00335, partial [Acidimicrobiia bacterium]|nr:hypothetical protein [Acidimicrobiia bacterium]